MADINKFIEQLQGFDINDVDWERVGVWPLPARVFLFLMAFGLIVTAGFFFVVKDKNMALAQAQNEENTLKVSFEGKAHEAANLDAYRTQMLQMEESFGEVIKQLPEEIEVPDLLEDLDAKVADSRLEMIKIDPLESRKTEFYVELPIRIEVLGGYHEFGAFVSGVAGMPRIVTLEDFDISLKNAETGLLRLDILAKTYKYKVQE